MKKVIASIKMRYRPASPEYFVWFSVKLYP
jgi:hypothetical protein